MVIESQVELQGVKFCAPCRVKLAFMYLFVHCVLFVPVLFCMLHVSFAPGKFHSTLFLYPDEDKIPAGFCELKMNNNQKAQKKNQNM
jgi:hypothetical protein